MEALKTEVFQVKKGRNLAAIYLADGYRKFYGQPHCLQRGAAVASLLENYPKFIYRNDLIAGSLRGLFGKPRSKAEFDAAKEIADSYGERNFWQNADHFSPDYADVLRCGIGGLTDRIDAKLRGELTDAQSDCLKAMRLTLRGFRAGARGYAAVARAAGKEDLAASLERIAEGIPASFRDALQLVWLIHTSFCAEGRYAMALGRIDQYLYPFYLTDSKSGALSDGMAIELLTSVFVKIGEHRALYGADDVVNLCIGGVDEEGGDAVNALSYLVLEAVKRSNLPGPNLSARISAKTPDAFLDAALQVIGTGLGYPALMNDEVNISALQKLGAYDLADIRNYSMVGCIENFITGKQPPWTDSICNTALCFEYVLFRGKALKCGARGLDTGDTDGIVDMDEFLARFGRQVEYAYREAFELFLNENDRHNRARYTQPFLSCFCDDCIGRAADVNMGGAKYPASHGITVMGIGTIADSLAAIDRVVFRDRAATLKDLKNAILCNYVGYESLRERLLQAPKYGNNYDFADRYAVWLVRTVHDAAHGFRTPGGGRVYLAMASNTHNIPQGARVAATPDGRLRGEALSDAASPMYGADVRGMTETVNSLTKVDYTLVATGTVVNQKLSPSVFVSDEKRAKLRALIRVYFDKGGQEMQINATSREVLEDAMKHPENYKNLVVRVSGFSAYYVTLDREIQHDILNRTQQT